ncbi:hypothetical protein ACINNAV113_2926 [Acinetobacter baumannii Naval-113]|nr:hypothetical protein ACINNAV113_2926 [Acinetobacter baumannii Naval-113]
MKLKTVTIDGKVYAEVDGDKPIYIHDDGKEMPHDAPIGSNNCTLKQ